MLFNSLAYLVFFPVVFALHWIVPAKYRTLLLLVASYVFYMTWKPAYGLLLLALTVGNYFLGKNIATATKWKKPLLTLGVALNLTTLAFFKYALFGRDLAAAGAHAANLPFPNFTFYIALPLGISFFVFEFIHYLVDVYRGREPVRGFGDFALFASFFPTQIAGPIKRFEDFVPQVQSERKLSIAQFDEGFSLIVQGLFKKVLLADTLCIVNQAVFPHPEFFTSLDCWLAVYAFAFQIYFDFSGYTDIARGSALMLGFKTPINFNLPYLAQSVSEFWHRWHISLSTWLRDYLFIPLGGSRNGSYATYRNLLITMVLGGLWHGAAAHFVVWGLYQGVLLGCHRMWCGLAAENALLQKARRSKFYKVAATVLTFHAVCLGWVFFRANDMNLAGQILAKLLFLKQITLQTTPFLLTLPSLTIHTIYAMIIPALTVLAVIHYLASRPAWLRPLFSVEERLPFRRTVWLTAAICLLIVFSPEITPRFIYFQF